MMKKHLAAMVAALALGATPVLAAPAAEPHPLTDAELDQVTAGESLLDLFAPITVSLENISVSLEIANVPVNAAAAVQVSAIGQAIQTAQVGALQQVTQVSQ
jgi:hypothetical protein